MLIFRIAIKYKQSHYNTTIYNGNKDNNHYYSNRQSSHDNGTEDMTITADMRIESISNASNDNTQCLYTRFHYVSHRYWSQ